MFLNVIFFNSNSDFNSMTPGSRHTMVGTGSWLRRTDRLYPVVVKCIKISGVPRSGMVSYVWPAGRLLEFSELFLFEAMYSIRTHGKGRNLGTTLARTYVRWNISRDGISTIFFTQKSCDYLIN